MEHVATAARAQTAATGAQLQRMTLRAVTTVATATVPSSSMAAPSTTTSLVPPDATLAAQPSATAATFAPTGTIATITKESTTAVDLTSSPPDGELPEGGSQQGDGKVESHRSIDDVVDDDDEDVDDVELTRGSSSANTPTSGSRIRERSSGMVSPTNRFHARESRGSQPEESANNDSTNSNSNDTSDLLLGLSENDSLYFTED